MKLTLTPKLPEAFPPGYQITFDRVTSYSNTNDMHSWGTSYGLNCAIHDVRVLYIEIVDTPKEEE